MNNLMRRKNRIEGEILVSNYLTVTSAVPVP